MGCDIVIVGAILACDEDTLRFVAADSTPSRFAAAAVSSCRRCVTKSRIDEEIPQRVVQRRTDILSWEPRWMREASRRTEQNMRLRRGCEQVTTRGKMELRKPTRAHAWWVRRCNR